MELLTTVYRSIPRSEMPVGKYPGKLKGNHVLFTVYGCQYRTNTIDIFNEEVEVEVTISKDKIYFEILNPCEI